MQDGKMKCVLLSVARCLPEQDTVHLTGCEVRRGWGGIIHVRLRASGTLTEDRTALEHQYCRAVSEALGAQRHDVQFTWDPAD